MPLQPFELPVRRTESTSYWSLSWVFAVIVSLMPLKYPMPYPISQADTVQPQKRSQEKAIALLTRTLAGGASGVSAVCGFRGKS